jgi:hypothetical protein
VKIKQGENVVVLDEPIDASANPNLVVYTLGDPEQNPRSFALPARQVIAADFLHLRNESLCLRGLPTAFAISHELHKTRLLLWPIPDKDYHAVFEFSPPRRRL